MTLDPCGAIVTLDGPGVPWAPAGPGSPCGPEGPSGPRGPREPVEMMPGARSLAVSEPSRTFSLLTAFARSWRGPTESRGSVATAHDVPPGAMNSDRDAVMLAYDNLARIRLTLLHGS